MEPATHPMKQNDLLKGMTSSLARGACWGLSARWLQECVSGGPAVAGLAMTLGATSLEALINHSENANNFLSGTGDDNSISNCTVMLTGAKLDAQRTPITNTGGYVNTAVSMIAAMSGGGSYYGLVVLTCPAGRHAMAVTNKGNVWSLYDPNFGTWVFAGDDKGAPTRFSGLLVDIFKYYLVSDVKLYTIIRTGL